MSAEQQGSRGLGLIEMVSFLEGNPTALVEWMESLTSYAEFWRRQETHPDLQNVNKKPTLSNYIPVRGSSTGENFL